MLNTGLLMRKPGESGYGRYRRFLIANNSTHLKLKPKKKKTTSWGNNIYEYRLAKFAAHLENRFLKRSGLKVYNHTIAIKKQYRPVKCCPLCLKAGFHSYVFDYEWLHYCPVHKTKLIDLCPECNLVWPTYSELNSRNCTTCGYKINFKKSANCINQSNEQYEVFNLIEDIVENRSKNFLSNASIGVPNISCPYFAERNLKQCINSKSVLLFSVLKHMNMLNTDEINKLVSLDDIEFTNMSSVHYHAKRLSHNEIFHLDQSYLITQKLIIEDQIEDDLVNNSKFKPLNHEIFTCINNDGVCSTCLQWSLYYIVISKDEFYYNSPKDYFWNVVQKIFDYKSTDISDSIIFMGVLDKLIIIERNSKPNKPKYLKIPDDISLMLYKVELQNLISKIKLETKNYELGEIVSWDTIAQHIINCIVNSTLGNYPLTIHIENEIMTALVPTKYLVDL